MPAWSLIVTVFGDAIAPRGGEVWLGTLTAIMQKLGCEDGVVRTALSRLASDGWVERERVGRSSFYRLTPQASRRSAVAAERIYEPCARIWTGRWHVLVLDESNGKADDVLRQRLDAEGFGRLSPGLLIAPQWRVAVGSPEVPPTAPPLAVGLLGLEARALVPRGNRALATRAWRLDELAASYDRLRQDLTPFVDHVPVNGLQALAIRIWVVHRLRRVALIDPMLPEQALPEDWPGWAARRIAAMIWRRQLVASENWLDTMGRCRSGPLPTASRDFAARFAYDDNR